MRIENSVMRVTVWHHKACLKMPNSYPELLSFPFALNQHYIFLHTFLRHLHLSLKMCYLTYFFNFTLKYLVQKKMFDSAPTYKYGVENIWRKMMSKLTSSRKKNILVSCKRRESSYIPQCKTKFPCSVLSYRNSCHICQKISSEKEILWKQGNHTRYE